MNIFQLTNEIRAHTEKLNELLREATRQDLGVDISKILENVDGKAALQIQVDISIVKAP